MKKKLLFDLTNSSTNSPMIVDGVFSAAILEANSISTFTPILNAKDSVKIGSHVFGNLVQDFNCAPSDQGAGTLSDKEVQVCKKQVYFTLCQDKFEESFLSAKMASGSNNTEFLPDEFKTYLGTKITAQLAADLEVAAWQGNTVATGSTYPNTICDGLQYKLSGDSSVVKVTSTAVTASNVVACLTAVYNAIPQAILTSKDLVIYVATNVARAYKLAQAATTGGLFLVGDKELNFVGIKLIEANGMASNKMVATLTTNLFKITDLVSDYEDITLIPQFDKTGKHQIIVSGAFKWAVDYVNPTQIVYYI